MFDYFIQLLKFFLFKLKQSEGIREADNQRVAVIQKIQSIASQIDQCKRSEEYYRDQLMRYDSRMMVEIK